MTALIPRLQIWAEMRSLIYTHLNACLHTVTAKNYASHLGLLSGPGKVKSVRNSLRGRAHICGFDVLMAAALIVWLYRVVDFNILP